MFTDRPNGVVRVTGNINDYQQLKTDNSASSELIQLRNALLNDTDGNIDKWMNKVKEEFDFARDAQTKFNDSGVEDKRYVLSRLGSNLILKDKNLRVDLNQVLEAIKEVVKEVNDINERLEPAENIDKTIQLEALYSESPKLLRS
jgi:hypothetical protein